MWIQANIGFFSIVEKPEDNDKGTVTIRSRIRSDLEALKLDGFKSEVQHLIR